MSDATPPVVPSAGLATDQEIMRQSLGKISDTLDRMSERQEQRDMDAMRRSQPSAETPPPPRSWYERYAGIINVVLAAFLTATITFVGVVYKDSSNRLTQIEDTANKGANGVERIDKERGARIANLDQWRESVEEELRVYRIGHSEFQQMKGTVGKLGEALSSGRDERLRDRETDRTAAQQSRDAIMGAIGELKTQVALLGQSIGGAQGRSPRSPFDQNQRWPGPLNLGSPSILKASFRANEEIASRPKVAPRRAVKRRARPRTFLVSLTRALERMGGKPAVRRRTWP